jgi:ComF family protein
MIVDCFKAITYLLSPPTCVGCHEFLHDRIPLCSACHTTIKPVLSVDVVITGKYMMRVYALGEYEGVVRSLVIAKQSGNRLAGHQLGQLMAERCCCDWQQADYLVPVPLHWRRYAARGFNQAEEIATTISKIRGVQVLQGVKRIKTTQYQASLEQQQRRINVHNAFYVTEKYKKMYYGKHIIIVDDLMTTGATLIEVARSIAACRPASISALVAARVILK